MKKSLLLNFCIVCMVAGIALQSFGQAVPVPETFFGFKPGSDRNLFDYEKLMAYFKELDSASQRVKMLQIGQSPMGRPMYAVFISSEANIKNLEKLRAINKRLALDPVIPADELQELVQKGRVFLLATLSMHSDEVGPTQASPLIAYDLATTSDPEKLAWLDKVVFMMVPNHNPDGMDMVVKNYYRYKGTKYEGAELPSVYHKYVGHDNNRDFVYLTQTDTRAIAAIFDKDWFPQVMIEKHQMGSNGVRYFVPPPHDPISENVYAEIWNWQWIYGSAMAKDMLNAGQTGVSQHFLFDDYWPGSTETCIWNNVIGMLTECASANLASPIYIEPNELTVEGKGLAEYKQSVNMTAPWPGGEWKLSDIVSYEIVSTMSLLKTSCQYKEAILRFSNEACRNEVEMGKTKPPYYYIIPQKQSDKSELVHLVNLLDEHGVNSCLLTHDMNIEGRSFHKGDIVVPLAQPFRAFAKEVLEKQVYPARHYTPNGEVIRPYDVASWSVPLHGGLECIPLNSTPDLTGSMEKVAIPFSLNTGIDQSAKQYILDAGNNESFSMAFHLTSAGFKVFRLEKETNINNLSVRAGSFLVDNDGSPKLQKMLAELTVPPISSATTLPASAGELKIPRIGLIETNFHDMDAGWTRFLFDTYGLPFTVIRPNELAKARLQEKFDCLVIPDEDKSVLMDGKIKEGENYYTTDYPPEYTKGMGKEGMDALITFLNNGGHIISWGESTNLFFGTLSLKTSETEKEEFQLPVRNIADNLKKEGMYCPGSLLNINLLQNHPLTYGLDSKEYAFFQGSPVLVTTQPVFDCDRRVIATFPESSILASGYCEKEEKLANRTAMVWVKKGKGQLVLFAFDPIFRASVPVTYKLLFNALLLN